MNLVDLIILILLLAGLARGLRSGIVRQAFGLLGFWGGLALGAVIAIHVIGLVPVGGRVPAVLAALTIGIFVGAVLGDLVGSLLSRLVRLLYLGVVDSLLGGFLGIVSVLFGVWLLAGLVAFLPFPSVNREVRASVITRYLTSTYPSIPTFISRLERSLVPTLSPRVFSGLEPAPAAPVEPAPSADVQQAMATDGKSVVKIIGLACGSVNVGSGFIVAPELVMTNAHVVGGVTDPVVYDEAGAHEATVVLFDPNTDLAALRVSGLAGAPLALDFQTMPRGTKVVALGYPEGGPFSGVSAGILESVLARGQNIYDTGVVERQVYEIQSAIQPGNSGGPLVLPDGRLAGIVFARSASDSAIGYALTSGQAEAEIGEAMGKTYPVGTGQCVSE